MKPLILITNDDGINSPSIKRLVAKLKPTYEIVVIAPKYPQSAKGCSHAHGDSWVSVQKKTREGIDWITVDGSPATCISVALRYYNIQPNLVISGINFGENLGLNLFYSGTIGAAWEAAMSGYMALAVSLELPPNMHYVIDKTVDFSVSVHFTKKIANRLLVERPTCLLWNMNIPRKATKNTEIREVKVGEDRWNAPVIREKRNIEDNIQLRFEYDPTGQYFDIHSDVTVIRAGYVSLTKIDAFQMPWAKKSRSTK